MEFAYKLTVDYEDENGVQMTVYDSVGGDTVEDALVAATEFWNYFFSNHPNARLVIMELL